MRSWWVWVGAAFAAGCGGSSGVSHAPDSGGGSDASDAGIDAREEQSSADVRPRPDAPASKDATGDANPLGALTACLGASMPIAISGQMPYVDVPVGSEKGEFVLDFGSTFSSIDLSAFAPPGPTTTGCNPSLLGVECTVEGFAFFAPPGNVILTTEDFSGLGGSVRQAGILGTDFLSEHVITVAYAKALVFASPSASFCSATALQAAGFVPLDTKGFYENDLGLLEPASDVDSSASSGTSVPNVPTVPVRVGTTAAIAQLDTGFDDDVTPFSVNINMAFFAAIEAANPSALVRDTSLDAVLTTCVSGVTEPVTGYRLAATTTFDFVTAGGVSGRSYSSTALFVKNTPPAAKSCGGIGTWSVPAAQVAASYYNDMGVIAFDPYAARVWIPKR